MANNTTNWILQLIDRVSGPAKKIQDEVDGIEKKGKKLGDCFKRVSAIDISAIGNSVTQLSGRFTEASQPGINFQSQLAEVSAITGVAGQKLNDLGDNARKTAKAFGGDAAAQLEAYKTVLSRLGPDIASSPKALDAMGQQIQILSKTMGGDAVGATNALTTAMLQYQVDLSNPIAASAEMAKMMNVMAAGAKYGAAEVPQVSAALEQTGVAAKLAKLSFEETNAAIQAMATGGKYGSEAGVALRNVLSTISAPSALSKDAVGVLSAYNINMEAIADTSKPFSERLKLLGPIQNDLNALTAVFGKENAANAQILLRSADAQVKMTGQITNTNVAQEQAGIIMDTFAERAKRTKAFFDDLKISFFNVAGGMLPIVQGGAGIISVLADVENAGRGIGILSNAFKSLEVAQKFSTAATKVATAAQWLFSGASQGVNLVVKSFKALEIGQKLSAAATSIATAAQWLFNAAISPIGIAVLAVAALGIAFYVAYQKSEKFRAVISGIINVAKLLGTAFMAVGKIIIGAFTFNKSLFLQGVKESVASAKDIANGGIGKAFSKGYNESMAKEPRTASKQTTQPRAVGVQPVNPPLGAGGKQTELSKVLNPKPINPLPVAGGTKPVAQGSQPASPKPGAGQPEAQSNKAITMNLTVNNHFNASPGMDIRKIADKIMEMVNDRLRDASLAI